MSDFLRYFLIAVWLWAFLVFVMPDTGWGRGPEVQRGQLTGIVMDHESQRPISEVVLRLLPLGLHTVSDDKGRFDFKDLPAGTYVLLAQRTGF